MKSYYSSFWVILVSESNWAISFSAIDIKVLLLTLKYNYDIILHYISLRIYPLHIPKSPFKNNKKRSDIAGVWLKRLSQFV